MQLCSTVCGPSFKFMQHSKAVLPVTLSSYLTGKLPKFISFSLRGTDHEKQIKLVHETASQIHSLQTTSINGNIVFGKKQTYSKHPVFGTFF